MNDITNQPLSEKAPFNKVAWILMGISLLFILYNHLLIALLAGLLVHELVYLLEPHLLRIARFKGDQAKIWVVAIVALCVITGLILIGVGIFHFFQAGGDNLPALMNKMAEILESSRKSLPSVIVQYIPDNIYELKDPATVWLREHAADIRVIGKEAGRALALALIGMIVGGMIALREVNKEKKLKPFPRSLADRVTLLAASFRRVVFAQAWIAALNTSFTALYIAILLPLFGVNLPFQKTIIALTFVFGLLPVIGNLITNVIIVIVSLSHSLGIAEASLIFLIAIHKAEYFLNARIVGSKIMAKAWELLLAMVLFESIFGIAGVVAAPIYYAYVKAELSRADLI